jgi:hypothetical protein
LDVAIRAVVSGAEARVTAGGVATGDGVVSVAGAAWDTNLSVGRSVELSVMVVDEER